MKFLLWIAGSVLHFVLFIYFISVAYAFHQLTRRIQGKSLDLEGKEGLWVIKYLYHIPLVISGFLALYFLHPTHVTGVFLAVYASLMLFACIIGIFSRGKPEGSSPKEEGSTELLEDAVPESISGGKDFAEDILNGLN